jgi:hypothetical protein
MGIEKQNRYQYDIPTAVTFLIAGLGLGSILTLFLAAQPDGRSSTPA